MPMTKFSLSMCSSGLEGHKFEPLSVKRSYRHPEAEAYSCHNGTLLHLNQQAPVMEQPARDNVWLKITDISE